MPDIRPGLRHGRRTTTGGRAVVGATLVAFLGAGLPWSPAIRVAVAQVPTGVFPPPGPPAPPDRSPDRSVVHPIYAAIADAPQNQLALGRFVTAARRFGLPPVETVDIEGDARPHTLPKLRDAMDLVRKLDLAKGETALESVAAEVAASGGADLDAAALSDLYLYRAWAISRADFNTEHVPAATARARAYTDVARAAMLAPGRQLNRQQFPPLLLDDWDRAVADVAARPQTVLVVRAAGEAQVSCDGGPAIAGPATFAGLAQGEHLIRVDEPGWTAWGATISVDGPSVEVQVPARRALSLDDADAAARARRMGAKFALVAEPRPGKDGGLSLSLRLVDVRGARRDSAIEPLAGDPSAFESAVMRLDEEARRIDRSEGTPVGPALAGGPAASLPPPVLVAPPPARPRLADDPGAWARQHWPLLAAVGAMLGTALILSLSVSGSSSP